MSPLILASIFVE